MNRYIAYHIVGIFVLLCFSFFFSCTETTLFSLSPFQVKKLSRGRRGTLISWLLANPRWLLTSILIGNMFVNIFSSTLGESLLRTAFGDEGTVLAIFIMTLAILVMGEVTPKTIAIQCNTRLAPVVAPGIKLIGSLLYPVRQAVLRISDRLIGLVTPVVAAEHAVTEDEIKTAIRIGSREGVVDTREKAMIQGVFDFATRRVTTLMRPRKEITAFEVDRPLPEIEEAIRRNGYSRIPVYEKNLDNIIGILYAKDLLGPRGRAPGAELRGLLRPAYFVPETKYAPSLLREFRRRKIHLAVVVDEYGGVAGIVTLEDLIEQIIGEMRDKGEPAAPLFQQLGKNSFKVRARMKIAEFNGIFGTDLKDEGNTTIGGFLTARAGRIPPEGARMRHGGLLFTVSAAQKNRIREVLVSREAPR
ncbi:MAG: hemolysin family protein [Chlamydiota bacterium]